MSVAWDRYLNAPVPPARFAECRRRSFAAFAEQRENIRRLIEATAPRSVACLGAGVLNDIPYRELVCGGVELHLVDWLPGAVVNGIDLSIIDRTDAGEPCCLYCDPHVAGGDFCERFQCACDSRPRVCESYAPCSDDPTRCRAFAKAGKPIVHQADVTGGYADAFGRRVQTELRGVRDWRHALMKGMSLARRIDGRHVALDIAEHSIDLVTSSMLLSQFEYEPYDFFSRCVAERIGPPSPQDETALRPLVEELRNTLLIRQVDRHFREIRRLLAPGGRCYLSFELFHRLDDANRWFVVPGMPRALEIAGRYFQLRFDLLPHAERLSRFQTGAAPSLACALILEPDER